MKNKEIQEQRMKGYFLQATKELLKGEGLQSVSVRSIAEKAGYSYTTMYSYFKDVNDLVFLCVHDFYEECRQHVKNHTRKKEKGVKSLQAAIKAYADYFIQYPGIFELFFTEKIGSTKDKKAIVEVITFSLDTVCEEEWNYCISKGLVQIEEVELMKAQARYMVTGLLLLYMNRRMPSSYSEFVNQLTGQVKAILEPTLGGDKVAMPAAGNTSVNNTLIAINVGNNR